jgi:hypothetical protein
VKAGLIARGVALAALTLALARALMPAADALERLS